MTAGRKRKPTALRILEGNRSRTPLPKDEPELVAEIPNAPSHLSEEAKRHWDTITNQLNDADMLTAIDGKGIELLCEAYTNWINANIQVRRHGLVVKHPKTGVPMPSPFVSTADKYFNQLRQMLVEYGMTPSSRARVKVAKSADKAKDKKSRFFSD